MKVLKVPAFKGDLLTPNPVYLLCDGLFPVVVGAGCWGKPGYPIAAAAAAASEDCVEEVV